ncbi:MAG: hypothetical protein J0I29_06770 [Rhizobiales bacterium]|nr:hypothetical protein [Hyphomicrobiales bacterium]
MQRSFGRFILAVFVTIGLTMGPFSLPVSSKSAVAQSSSEMSGDMPCCPDTIDRKMPQRGGCDGCPLMALCNGTILQAAETAELMNSRLVLLAVISVHDDRFAEGLIGAPPKRPPRSMV